METFMKTPVLARLLSCLLFAALPSALTAQQAGALPAEEQIRAKTGDVGAHLEADGIFSPLSSVIVNSWKQFRRHPAHLHRPE
jgi:hypothetical protein